MRKKGYMYQNRTLFDEPVFTAFVRDCYLSDTQAQQFATYVHLLQEWNKKINLTALKSVKDIIQYHFRDSLALKEALDLTAIKVVVDVGTGAGFPGIPLNICYPHMRCILIEVNTKKIAFLRNLIDQLHLKHVELYEQDWRTFLRTTHFDADLILARASLAPNELLRMFKPGCQYKTARLIYWASRHWQPENQEKRFIKKDFSYQIDGKKRRLIFFSTNANK